MAATRDELFRVVRRFADAWKSDDLREELAGSLSCTEVAALTDLLRAGGEPEQARQWELAHAEADVTAGEECQFEG
ncbi:hypothetical protein AB0958_18960 [Streptomyces sp. NPDC006655]|uniref:hypothetical protein n=1 Tax=Streptomyces sp. NPDC006655 TaxID=3156898 RepID=UPI003455FD67